MKKFTSMIAALLIAVASFAAVPANKVVKKLPAEPVKAQMFKKAGAVQAPRDLKSDKLRARRKAASDYTLISEQPEGELKTFTRGGGHYFVESSSLYYEDQSGTTDIVFGKDNKVYIHDIIMDSNCDTWVEGTLSEDNSQITVALGQNIYYSSTYDACVALCLIKYDAEEGFSTDLETKEVVFSVDKDGVIALQGTSFAEISLGAYWTDDFTIGEYGDYETVFTPYEANVELVTLPEGAETVEMPLSGTFYASFEDFQYDNAIAIDSKVKVAIVDGVIYIQGLIYSFPEAWVAGELNGDVLEIPVTYVGESDNGHEYAIGYSNGGIAPIEFIYDKENGTYELDGYLILNSSENEFSPSSTIDAMSLGLFIGVRPEAPSLPEGLEAVEMPVSGVDAYEGEEFSGTVNVAFDEDGNVYIQGLMWEVPEGWMIGQFNDDHTQVIFKTGQYVGAGLYGSIYAVGGDDEDNIIDIVFDYDAIQNVFTLQNYLYENGKADDIYFYNVFANIVIGIAADDIWVAAEQGYENAQEIESIDIAEGVTGALAKNDGSLTPKYYDKDESLRLYACNSLTITSDKTLAKIVITMTDTEQHMVLEANVGEYELEGNVGTWNGEANEVVFSVPCESGIQARIVSIQLFYLDYSSMIVEVPEDLETAAYSFKGTDGSGDEVSSEVQVGFYDGEVYIQGLCREIPDAWVKGTLQDDGTVVIPNWFIGTIDLSWIGWGEFNISFGGATFHYDAENDIFTCEHYETIDDGGYFGEEYSDVVLSRLIDMAGTPVDPEITDFTGTGTFPKIDYEITLEDTDGNALVSSLVSYIFYIKKGDDIEVLVLEPGLYEYLEDAMTEIPYNFSDDWDIYNYRLYLNQGDEMKTWDAIGIQVIYRGGGEENRSNIVWYDLSDYWPEDPTGLNSVSADVIETINYDVLGRRVSDNTTGIIIQKVRMSDGSTRTIKVLNRNK